MIPYEKVNIGCKLLMGTSVTENPISKQRGREEENNKMDLMKLRYEDKSIILNKKRRDY
jgi:hypothetical protein